VPPCGSSGATNLASSAIRSSLPGQNLAHETTTPRLMSSASQRLTVLLVTSSCHVQLFAGEPVHNHRDSDAPAGRPIHELPHSVPGAMPAPAPVPAARAERRLVAGSARSEPLIGRSYRRPDGDRGKAPGQSFDWSARADCRGAAAILRFSDQNRRPYRDIRGLEG